MGNPDRITAENAADLLRLTPEKLRWLGVRRRHEEILSPNFHTPASEDARCHPRSQCRPEYCGRIAP